MSTTVESIVMPPVRVSQKSTHASPAWLVNPWFDALFLANVAWPVLAALLVWFGPEFHEGTRFWQVYFVTAPHRWITLALVFLDRDRFQERPRTFVLLAVAVIALCFTVRISTGTLTCLLAIDYLWNAWHFASQHAGIVRIYARQSGASQSGGQAGLEKLLIRGFVLYVILRMSGLEWSLIGENLQSFALVSADWSPARLEAWLQGIDWCVLGLPAVLATIVLGNRGRNDRGGLLYLASFLSLYGALLAAVHVHRFDLVLLLSTVSALFHATEYLAIVSWSVQRRFPGRSTDHNLLARMVPQWGLAVGSLAISLAVIGWVSDRQTLQGWLLLNIVAAFLHYAYDGLIWKRGRGAARRTA